MKRTIFLLALIITATFVVNAQQDSTLKQYTGHYTFSAGSPAPEATVKLDSTSMTISSAIGTATLVKMDGDVFNIVEYNGTATFLRNKEGKISGIHVVVADLDLTGTKEEQAANPGKPNLFFKY
jgi:hypothetical protein